MFGLFDWVKIGAGVALGALVAAGPVYLYGTAKGRQQAAVAALEVSVKVLRERNEIDGEVSSSDAAALCRDLGLLADDEAECVRRIREAAAEP
jgi:hypothetical protein